MITQPQEPNDKSKKEKVKQSSFMDSDNNPSRLWTTVLQLRYWRWLRNTFALPPVLSRLGFRKRLWRVLARLWLNCIFGVPPAQPRTFLWKYSAWLGRAFRSSRRSGPLRLHKWAWNSDGAVAVFGASRLSLMNLPSLTISFSKTEYCVVSKLCPY